MHDPTPRLARARSIADTLAWIWIALAPWVVVAGFLLGAIDRPRAQETDEVGGGALLGRASEGWTPLDLLDTAIRARVAGPLARASMTQSFRNDTGETLEAVYVFPLPDDAAVSAMEMRIGERRIVSVVREREEAKRTYAAARAEGRKAALVEQGRPNLFRTSVANVLPGETVEVALDWVFDVDRDGDTFSVVLPLAHTPRFGGPVFDDMALPGDLPAGRPPVGSRGRPGVPEASVEVRIDAGLPLESVDSPTHALATRYEGDDLVVEPGGGRVAAVRDVVVRWTVAPSSVPRAALHLERGDDATYALVQVLPPDDDLAPPAGLPSTTLFVLDVSGSMNGPSIVQARAALDAALARLRPDDAFDVLTFADDVRALFGRFVPADATAVAEARRWVRAEEIRGGTDILGALRSAVDRPWPDDDGLAVPRIVFLTDGAVSNEDAILREIVARLGGVRLHALGIGAAPNRWLMRAMAERGGGLCAFVRSDEPGESGIDRFLERVDRPVWSSPRLAWSGAVPQETYPSRLPDLHAGEAITVVARFGPGETPAGLTVAGATPAGPVEVEVDVRGTGVGPAGIGTRWARAKVDELLGGLHEGAAEADVRPRVVAVALAHGLVTRYTARVAVETHATASRDAVRVDVPNGVVVPLPQGGTMRPLARLAGILCALAGALLWLAARR